MGLNIWNIIIEYSIRLWVWYIPYRTMKNQLYRGSIASGNHSTGTTLTETCSFYFRTAHFTTLSKMVNDLYVPVSNAFCPNLFLNHPPPPHPSLPNLHTLSLRFYWWLLKLLTAWNQIIFANWSAEGNQLDIPSDPAKKLCLRFQAARYSQHLVVEHSVMRPQSSGTTYLAKYPALTLCQVLNAFWKHIFWNKLLIFTLFHF